MSTPNFWIASKETDGTIHFHRDDNALAMCGTLLSAKANPVDIEKAKWHEVCGTCVAVNRVAHEAKAIPRRAE